MNQCCEIFQVSSPWLEVSDIIHHWRSNAFINALTFFLSGHFINIFIHCELWIATAFLIPQWMKIIKFIEYPSGKFISKRKPAYQTQGIHPMLFKCWSSVFDAGPTLKQNWLNISCVLYRAKSSTREFLSFSMKLLSLTIGPRLITHLRHIVRH